MATGFLSREAIAVYSQLRLVRGWALNDLAMMRQGPFASDIRLFDAPVVNGFFVPEIRLTEVVYTYHTYDKRNTLCPRRRSVRKGGLIATDERFIIVEDKWMMIVNYPTIRQCFNSDGVYRLVVDAGKSGDSGINCWGTWDGNEDEDAQGQGELLLRPKFPQGGLLSAAFVLSAPSHEREYRYALERDTIRRGQSFADIFTSFLNEIVLTNLRG